MFSALLIALLIALLVGLGACRGEDEALGPTGTVGPGPTSTSTTSTTVQPVDVSTIPGDRSTIDEAYVQAVVDALFAVDAQATNIFVTTQRMDEEAMDILASIYTPDELAQQLDVWFGNLAHGSDDLLSGALVNDVKDIIGRADDCIFFQVTRSYAGTTTKQVPARTTYLGITPKLVTDDPEQRNPTAWMLFTDGFNEDGSRPEDPCLGR